jgi:hypothetical protein
VNVDGQVPEMPDFLRWQIKRMKEDKTIELKPGQMKLSELTDEEKRFEIGNHQFDDYFMIGD